MNRVIIAISAILLASIVLLKVSDLPPNSNSRKMYSSSFSISTSSSQPKVNKDLLSDFAQQYSFLSKDSLQDKTVVVCFWEPDSEASKEALPYLNTLAQKSRTKKVLFIAATPVSSTAAGAFLKKHKYNLVMKQVHGQVALKIFNEMLPPTAVSGILPVYLIINPQSEIVLMQEGFSETDIKTFERYLESQLMR